MSPSTSIRKGRVWTTRPQKDEPARGETGSRRILVLNYEYPPLGGGASPVTQAVCRELARHGNHVDVITMSFRGLPDYEEEPNLRVFRIPCWRGDRHICHQHELFTYVISAFFQGMKLARDEQYDVIHSHFFLPCGIVAREIKRRTGIPYAITAHGSDVAGYNPDRFRLSHRLLAPLWRVIVRDAAEITSPSQSLADLINSNYGEELNIRIIPNGISENWIVPGKKERKILLVSRLFERKGAQYLLEALKGTSLDHEVHIVGEGPYRPRLERLAKELDTPVHFHGWVENHSPVLSELYQKSSIFVFPSIAENFPISLLEAMLSGSAIVATGLASCREVLGEAARFVEPGGVEEIRSNLLDLAGSEQNCRRLGESARRRVLDHFTWERVGQRYHDLFVSMTVP